MKLIDFAACQR